VVIRQALGDQRNSPISEVKQGTFRLGELNSKSWFNCIVLHNCVVCVPKFSCLNWWDVVLVVLVAFDQTLYTIVWE